MHACLRSARLLALALFVALGASAAPVANLVADLNTTLEEVTEPLFLSQDFAALGSTLFFVADDGIHGLELWKTDGSAAGTALVEDICPGVCGGWPQALTVSGGVLFFAASDGSHGREPGAATARRPAPS